MTCVYSSGLEQLASNDDIESYSYTYSVPLHHTSTFASEIKKESNVLIHGHFISDMHRIGLTMIYIDGFNNQQKNEAVSQ
jgi:hypothetical protein